jgi:hypothetical protein
VNVDYVWGFSDTEAQHWMPPGIWVAALMILLPALLYAPVHFLLRRGSRCTHGERRRGRSCSTACADQPLQGANSNLYDALS